jgi:hypothetical protein
MSEMAKFVRELYVALQQHGFTETQALAIVGATIGAAVHGADRKEKSPEVDGTK